MSYKLYQQQTKPKACFLMGDASSPYADISGNRQVANTKFGSTLATLGTPLVAGAANSSIFDNNHVGEFTHNDFQKGLEARNWALAAWVLPMRASTNGTQVTNLEIVPEPGATGSYTGSAQGFSVAPTATNSGTGGPINNGPYRRFTASTAYTPTSRQIFMLQQMSVGGASTASLLVNPGEIYNTSIYVRASIAQTVCAFVQCTNSSGTSSGTLIGSNVTLIANTWTRISVSGTMPAATQTLRLEVHSGSTGNIAWANGSTFDISAAQITSSTTLQPFFDGANGPNGEDTNSVKWTGTTNASTSVWLVSAGTQTILSHTGQTDGLSINGNVIRFSTDYASNGSAAVTYDLQVPRKVFVVAIHSAQHNELWVDGVQVAQVDITNLQQNDVYVTTTNKLYAGTTTSSARVALSGVAFYNAITSEDIQTLYTQGNNVVTQDKVAPQFDGNTYDMNRDIGSYFFDQTWESTDEFNFGEIINVSVYGDKITPIYDATGTSIAGTWKVGVPLDSTGATSIYGVAVQWSGSGINVDVSLDGAAWTAAKNGELVSILPSGTDPTGKDMHLRVSVVGSVLADPAYLDSIRVIGFLDNTISNGMGRTMTLTSPAVLRDDYEPCLFRDDNGVSLHGGTLTIGLDTSVEPKATRTLEMWIKVLSGTPTISITGTKYRNGVADTTLPVGQWSLVHIVSASDLVSSITITGDVIIGQTSIYPTALTSTQVLFIFQSYMGWPVVAFSDTSAITVTEPGAPVNIYAHDWSVDGGGG